MSDKTNFVDDFLPGSYTIYNYNPVSPVDYCLYPQIVGFQKIGPKYYNEVSNVPVYMINYTIKGEGLYQNGAGEYKIQKGDLIFANNTLHHVLQPHDGSPWEFYFIHLFENQMVSDIYRKIIATSGSVIRNVPEDKVVPYINQIVDLLGEEKEDSVEKISLLIYSMLLGLVRIAEARKRGETNATIDHVMKYIKENYFRSISIEELVDQTNYSKNHLERLFKAQTGTTMQDYLFYRRLLKAEELLTTTNLSLKEIASRVGLSEYRSLYHMFMKALKISPSEYRARSGVYRKSRKAPKK